MLEKEKISTIDCNGRDFGRTVLYYGVEEMDKIDEFQFRNHIWKSRAVNGDIPKFGKYITAGELGQEMYNIDQDTGHLAELNINFRNVQYVQCGSKIFWVYCFDPGNIYLFRFIGKNLSPKMLENLLSSIGFKLGYIHHPPKPEPEGSHVDVWYNPNRMIVIVFYFDEFDNIVKKKTYFKKFDSRHIIKTSDTTCLFERNNKFMYVPLMDIGEYDRSAGDILPWTQIIELTEQIHDTSGLDNIHWEEDNIEGFKYSFIDNGYLTTAEYEEDIKDPRFDSFNYEEMITVVFNKGSSNLIKESIM